LIQYIERSNLDVEKYNFCIENSINSRIYAFSWYLDIVADNWHALVLDDYRAVMPLPWRSKFLIKYVYTPCWTQQLGVFSSDKINEDLIDSFIKNIPKKFKKITINFNSGNQVFGKHMSERINYILPLNKAYKELFRGYKYIRRRRKKRLPLDYVKIAKTASIIDIIKLHKKQKRFIQDLDSKPDYVILKKLVDYLLETKRIEIIIALEEDTTIGGAIFLKDKKRITYLMSAVSQTGRSKQSMTLIIDSVIEKYSNSNYVLDFEGSMIPGIAFFFKSFGAIKENYYLLSKNKII